MGVTKIVKQHSSINPKLKMIIPVVHGLAKVLGKDYEVNLHDLSMPEHSLIVCENGHVTGRSIGSPMTDFGLYMMQADEYKNKDGVFNYLAKNNRGEMIKCSCIFIRDDENKMIGFLCINYDISKAETARKLIDGILHFEEKVDQYPEQETLPQHEAEPEKFPVPVREWFAQDLEEVVSDSLMQIKKRVGMPLNYLSKPEKHAVINELHDKGFFLLKGAVDILAKEMGNTKYTIYAYIREVQKENTEKTNEGEK